MLGGSETTIILLLRFKCLGEGTTKDYLDDPKTLNPTFLELVALRLTVCVFRSEDYICAGA